MRLKKTIYIIVVVILITPSFQYCTNLLPETELSGYFKKEEVNIPELSQKTFEEGAFQKAIEKYWKSELGLKNWLIKLNNQVDYSLFNSTSTHTVIGKDKVLYTEYYIKTHLGEDFIGDEEMHNFIGKVKFIQDTLQKLNKFFFVLVAPGKPALIPEKIPDYYFEIYPQNKTNYEALIQEANKQGLNLFDARNYLISETSLHNYPIFPKSGIHWSGHAVAHVSDTLLAYIESNSNFSVPDIKIGLGEVTVKDYRYTDYDIGEAMNLLFFASDEELHYPNMKFNSVPEEKPAVLGVGDSFIQSFFGFYPVLDSCFSKRSMLWYYNQTLGWPLENIDDPIKAQWMDLSLEVKNKDIFILEMTDENIRKKGYGFVDRLYDHFMGNNAITENMAALSNKLKQEENTIKLAERIHAKVGYSREEMINALVENKLRNQWLIDFDYDKEVQKVIGAIKADSVWFESVKEKAFKKNITIEESLKADAIWVVNNNLGLN